jgi:hypothetical protein
MDVFRIGGLRAGKFAGRIRMAHEDHVSAALEGAYE